MPVIHPSEAVPFEVHGSRFVSYVSPSRGSDQVCAWQLQVPADLRGTAHRPTRDEVLLILDGELHVTLDGRAATARHGDVVLVPAGTELTVDGGAMGASVWVTTTPGLQAVLADGKIITPLWAR